MVAQIAQFCAIGERANRRIDEMVSRGCILLSLIVACAAHVVRAQDARRFSEPSTLAPPVTATGIYTPTTFSTAQPAAYAPQWAVETAGYRPYGFGGSYSRREPEESSMVAPSVDGAPHVSTELSVACDECDRSPLSGLVLFFAYEAFRGIPDGGWQNNGLNAGANYGQSLGWITEATGIAAQFGGSMGVYNWSGSDYRMQNQDQASTQGFLTYGLYRRAADGSPWNVGIVHDWMLNTTFSVFGENPTLGQLRAQVGYEMGRCDEVGLWGAYGLQGDWRTVRGFGPTRWQPIDQLNVYWRHHWQFGSDTAVWVGVPERSRLAGDGSLGDYIAAARVDSPLNDRVAAYALITYMHPSASAGPAGAREDEWSFAIGLSFYPGRNALAPSISGHRELPLLPVASNGLFMVDSNHWY